VLVELKVIRVLRMSVAQALAKINAGTKLPLHPP
jgi:hypothetical protein